MKTFAAIKRMVSVTLCVLLLMLSCFALADSGTGVGAIDEGYRGLNAVEAHEYFIKHVIPAKIKAARQGTHERNIWKNAKGLRLRLLTELPSGKNTSKLHEERLGNISDQLKPYAVEKYRKAIELEPTITKDVLNAAVEVGSGLYGAAHRIKNAGEDDFGTCRIADKIRLMIDKGKKDGKVITYEQAVDGIEDFLRYTVACSPFGFDDEFQSVVAKLEEKGYKLIYVSNTWDNFSENRPYRGINSGFISPDGQKFEVEFHTAESYALQRMMHAYYDIVRKPEIAGTELAAILHKYEYMFYAKLTRPYNIGKIKDYQAENVK